MFVTCLKFFFNYKGEQLVSPYGFELDEVVSMERYIHAKISEEELSNDGTLIEFRNPELEKTIISFPAGQTIIIGVSITEMFDLRRNKHILENHHDFIEDN